MKINPTSCVKLSHLLIILNLGVLPRTSPDKIWLLMNAWSRHRNGIRQYIKDKPTRWGIKLWVLADSSNGYIVDFNVYIGKAAGQQTSEFGLGYNVVMRLMRPFLHQGYHLFLDNFIYINPIV